MSLNLTIKKSPCYRGLKERILLAAATVIAAAAAVAVIVYVLGVGREKLVNGEIDFSESVAGVIRVAVAFL